MTLILYPLFVFLLSGLVLIFFVAIMSLKEKWSLLPWYAKVIVAPWAIFGVFLDLMLNWICSYLLVLSTPDYLAWPPELFTGHLDRLISKQNIQGKAARMWCKILDFFQQGGHCHPK